MDRFDKALALIWFWFCTTGILLSVGAFFFVGASQWPKLLGIIACLLFDLFCLYVWNARMDGT